jgi:hypothetical protein
MLEHGWRTPYVDDPETEYRPPSDPTAGQGVTAITKANPGVITIIAASLGFAVNDPVYVSGVGGMSELNNRFFTVGSIAPITGGFDIVLKDGGVNVDTSTYGTYTGGGIVSLAANGGVAPSGVATCQNNLFDTGAFNTIAWAAVPGAQRYHVYKLANGLFGYIGQTPGTSFVDDNIAPDISKTPPLQDNPFAGVNQYPAAVGYFEQRRCFAGPIGDPSYFWATRSGTESSLAYSIPGRDDDSIRFRIAARERSAIRHIVPMANLVLLTESSEWRVSPASGEVLTPDVSVRAQSFIGASDAQPLVVNNNLVFAAARGGHVRELAYNWQANGYINGDMCLRAPHLFDGRAIVEMAYAKAPVPIVWCVSSGGELLGITYVPEQDVGPWHRHDTQGGVFESICVVPEGDADVLYAVIRRTTALGQERFIERMEARLSEDDETGFFVDSGLLYDGVPKTIFGGLGHLEGKTVAILADGGVAPSQVVTGGSVTIPEPASLVYIGLPIEADLKTLPLSFEVQGYGQGRPKNVSKAWLRVFQSRSIHIGPAFDKLTEHKPRSNEPYGTPPALITREIAVALTSSWVSDGAVCLRHRDPLPLTVVSLTLEFAVGG